MTVKNRKWLLSILALMVATVAGVLWLSQRSIVDTKDMAARQQLQVIDHVLQRYKADHGHYPTSDPGLAVLVDPSPTGRYLINREALVDPWGHAFVYRVTQDAYLLYSRGPNGVDDRGQGDDILGTSSH